MQRRRVRAAAVLLSLFAAGHALAQGFVDALPPDDFYEEFDEVPNVSGGQLLGLRIEGDKQWPAVDSPIFLKPPSETQTICVRVATQDGRYRASNPFGVPQMEGSSNIRLATLTKSYLSTLSRYLTEEIAVRAYVAHEPGCSPQFAVNIPFVSDTAGGLQTLVLYVNSGGLDVQAALFETETDEAAGAAPIATGLCTGLGSSGRIAYNSECRITLQAAPARVAMLRIDFDDGFSTSHLRARVALPEIASE